MSDSQYFDRPYDEREEDRKLSVAALRRAAVQERHSVRRDMLRWADLMESGVRQNDFDGVLALWIPVFDRNNTLDGHFRVLFSFENHELAKPQATVEYEPMIPEVIK